MPIFSITHIRVEPCADICFGQFYGLMLQKCQWKVLFLCLFSSQLPAHATFFFHSSLSFNMELSTPPFHGLWPVTCSCRSLWWAQRSTRLFSELNWTPKIIIMWSFEQRKVGHSHSWHFLVQFSLVNWLTCHVCNYIILRLVRNFQSFISINFMFTNLPFIHSESSFIHWAAASCWSFVVPVSGVKIYLRRWLIDCDLFLL